MGRLWICGLLMDYLIWLRWGGSRIMGCCVVFCDEGDGMG